MHSDMVPAQVSPVSKIQPTVGTFVHLALNLIHVNNIHSQVNRCLLPMRLDITVVPALVPRVPFGVLATEMNFWSTVSSFRGQRKVPIGLDGTMARGTGARVD
jgi:hypothetical protein